MSELLPEPCLTVLDSFILRTVAKGQLEEAMYEAFRLTTGTESPGCAAPVHQLVLLQFRKIQPTTFKPMPVTT